MAPINLPDGTEVSEIVLPDGSTASEVLAPDGSTVFSAIPDSVVSREADNDSTTEATKFGLRFYSDVEWPSIGAEISANTSNATTAYIYRVSDGTLMGQTDITGLGAGDTFTVGDVGLQAYDGTDATTYNFVLDAGGSNWTAGYRSSTDSSFPYTSSDGNLTLETGAEGETGTDSAAISLIQIGDVGFS